MAVSHLLDGGTRLVKQPDQFGAFVADARPGDTWTYAATQLCVDGPGTATVTRVRPRVVLEQVRVDGFAVTPVQAVGNRQRQDVATYVRKLESVYTAPVTRLVATRCSKALDLRDLAVQMTVPKELPAIITGFDVTYRADGHDRELHVGNTIVFCSGDRSRDQDVAIYSAEHPTMTLAECPAP